MNTVDLLNNQHIFLYPRGQCVLLKSEHIIYSLKGQKPYRVNQDGYKILKYMNEGITFFHLKQLLEIHSLKKEKKLANFLNDLIEKQFLTFREDEKGKLVEKISKDNHHLLRVFLETTQRCNLRCKHCYVGDSEYSHFFNELTEKEEIEIIRQAEKMGVIQFDFTGGELFVKKGIRNILKAAAKASMFSNIFTNAILIDEETAIFLKELGNIHTVYVSLDDMYAEGHDCFRGVKGAYEKTINALEILKKYKIPTVINLIINRKNHLRLKEIILFYKNTLQIPCRVAPILYVGRGLCMWEERLSLEEIMKAIMQWYDAYGIPPLMDGITGKELNLATNCGIGESMVFIKADGEVSLCPTLTSKESEKFNLGNIRKQSLEDIWNTSENLNDFRNLFCKQSNCTYAPLCRSGCRSRAFLWNKDIRAEDPVPCHFFHTLGNLNH